jgi:steroid delta-isomerase-like uncharacterized protein
MVEQKRQRRLGGRDGEARFHRSFGQRKDSLRHDIAVFQSALDGLREDVDDMISEGDRVAIRYTLHATHTGDFYGVKATGKTIKVSGIEIFRIEDGKIAGFLHFGEPIQLA